ncbi:hypothetical protein V1522DRAFT_374041 [Lipomyces starkeyi]
MSLVYGQDPHPASARRASQSVALIATPASEIGQHSNREPTRNATRVTAKRKAMDKEPGIHVVSDISTTRNNSHSRLVRDSSEHGKPLNTCLATVSNMPPVTEEGLISDYKEAFRLLKDNPPEQRLEIHWPHSMYLQLKDAYSELMLETNISDDQKYPYLSYNSFTETITVVTVPNSIHEVAVYELNSEIIASANEYLSEHAPGLLDNILPLGSTTTEDFDGDYAHSSKQPDGGIKYAIDAESNVMIAIEVGISQSYKSLCDAKDMWINGHHVKVCVLVCLNESPRFNNPTTAYDSIEDVRTEMATMKQSVAEQMREYKSRGYYGPIVYRRHRWTGKLNEAFIEIWRAGNSSPERYELIQAGLACPNRPTTLGLKISDMVPDEAWEAAGVSDREIRFNGARFVGKLVNAVLDTAKERFVKFISFSEN